MREITRNWILSLKSINMTNDSDNDSDHLLCPQVPTPDHLLHRGGAACGHSGLVPRPLTRYVIFGALFDL